MNKQFRSVILFGLASQAFAVTAMFAILSGLLTGGTQYIPAFAGSAVALVGVALLVYRRNDLAERHRFIIWGAILMMLGAGVMVWIDPAQILLPLFFFGGLGVFMLLRMSNLVNDMRYIRQSLLTQYKLDLQLIVLFILYTIFFQDDPSWQTKMVPFFVIFLFLRMSALSRASRLERGVKSSNTRMEKLQNNMPMMIIGVVVFAGWIFNSLGVPVLKWVVGMVLAVINPIFYAVGYLVEYIVNWIRAIGDAKGTQQTVDDMKEANGEPPPEEFYFDDGSHLFNETTLFILTAIGLLILILYFFRRMKRAQLLQASVGIVEMREFIHADKPKKSKARGTVALGAITEMRKTYRRFLLTMKKAGYTRGTGETANEYIAKIAQSQPDMTSSMQELTDYYMQERYGARAVDDKLPRADELSKQLTKEVP